MFSQMSYENGTDNLTELCNQKSDDEFLSQKIFLWCYSPSYSPELSPYDYCFQNQNSLSTVWFLLITFSIWWLLLLFLEVSTSLLIASFPKETSQKKHPKRNMRDLYINELAKPMENPKFNLQKSTKIED